MPTILIVDDDPHIRDVVSFALRKAGFRTVEAEDGRQALTRFEAEQPDLIVLDILIPEMDGTAVCRELRKQTTTPIVFLSSVDDEIDRILGLELGGDDYVTKPFSPRELVARIRAVLRRTNSTTASTTTDYRLQHGRVRIDLEAFKAYWNEREVVLTVTEFGILRTLLGHPGKVFTRDQLMDAAYDLHKIVSDRTIDSHVRRVRAKFNAAGGDPIVTVHGLGYKLGPC
jgi:two-component system OmpR family response regulator